LRVLGEGNPDPEGSEVFHQQPPPMVRQSLVIGGGISSGKKMERSKRYEREIGLEPQFQADAKYAECK
jgi:hypothetical protein